MLLAVSAFRRPMPHLAKTLSATFGAADSLLTGSDLGWTATGTRCSTGGDRGWCGPGGCTPSHKQLAQLRLRNISLARFYGERLASALICSVMVAMLWWAAVQIGGPVGFAVPFGAVLAAAAFGWFLPALRIASSAQQVTEDASEALLVYIDLVVLGRMANKHARDRARPTQRRSATTPSSSTSARPWPGPSWSGSSRGQNCGGWPIGSTFPRSTTSPTSPPSRTRGSAWPPPSAPGWPSSATPTWPRRQREADRITQRMELPKFLPVMVVSLAIILPPLMKIAG